MKSLKIGLVFDLRDEYMAEGFSEEQIAEFDSKETIKAIEETLQQLGHYTERIGHGRSLCKHLSEGKRWDIVFTIAEGMFGRSREAQVPCVLEMFNIPYTFSDPLTCALTLDKAMTKVVVASGGLNTPPHFLVRSVSEIKNIKLRFPLFAKPVAEGTGKGVDKTSKIESLSQLKTVCSRLLKKYNQPVLVEEYLPGREFTTAILGTGKKAKVLGTMEIRVKPGAPAQDYSFQVKELCEKFVDYLPMEAGSLREKVERLALQAHRLLECRDASRVDIRLNDCGEPFFLEINPLPGLHPTHSDLPMIATQQGMSYNKLLETILTSTCTRYGLT